MTHPDRDPTVTEPWREAYEAWRRSHAASSADNGLTKTQVAFRAGFLASLEARAQPATFTEEQIERAGTEPRDPHETREVWVIADGLDAQSIALRYFRPADFASHPQPDGETHG